MTYNFKILLRKFLTWSPLKVFFVLQSALLGMGALYIISFNIFLPDSNSVASSLTNKEKTLLISLLVAPLLETFVFQTFLLQLWRWAGGVKFIYRSLFVSFFFSIFHNYNTLHIILSFMACNIFNFSYHIAQKRKWMPYIYTTLLHSLANATTTIPYIFIVNNVK